MPRKKRTKKEEPQVIIKSFEQKLEEYKRKAEHIEDVPDKELKNMLDGFLFLFVDGDLRTNIVTEYTIRFGNWDAMIYSMLEQYACDLIARDDKHVTPEFFETLYITFYEIMTEIAKINGVYSAQNEIKNRRLFSEVVKQITGSDADAFFKK